MHARWRLRHLSLLLPGSLFSRKTFKNVLIFNTSQIYIYKDGGDGIVVNLFQEKECAMIQVCMWDDVLKTKASRNAKDYFAVVSSVTGSRNDSFTLTKDEKPNIWFGRNTTGLNFYLFSFSKTVFICKTKLPPASSSSEWLRGWGRRGDPGMPSRSPPWVAAAQWLEALCKPGSPWTGRRSEGLEPRFKSSLPTLSISTHPYFFFPQRKKSFFL